MLCVSGHWTQCQVRSFAQNAERKSCNRISDRSIAPSVRLRFRLKVLLRLLRRVAHQLLPALRRCQVRRSLHLENSSTFIMARPRVLLPPQAVR